MCVFLSASSHLCILSNVLGHKWLKVTVEWPQFILAVGGGGCGEGQIYGGGGSCQINRTSIQARNGQAGEEVWRIQN